MAVTVLRCIAPLKGMLLVAHFTRTVVIWFMPWMKKSCPNLFCHNRTYYAIRTCCIVPAGQVTICFILIQWTPPDCFFILCPAAFFHFGFIFRHELLHQTHLRATTATKTTRYHLHFVHCYPGAVALLWRDTGRFSPNNTKLWCEFVEPFVNGKKKKKIELVMLSKKSGREHGVQSFNVISWLES